MKSNVEENGKLVEKSVVVVGTCREVNYDWIVQKRLYNLPLPKGGNGGSYSAVTHVVVYAKGREAIAFKAKYAKDVDGAWLKENGYRVAKVPHAERYALFELGKKTTDNKILSNKNLEVYVCSTRWTGRITPEFFDKPLPQCGGKSVPNIFERLRPFFSHITSACAFNPVQMDFLTLLRTVGANATLSTDTRPIVIDLFAGCGGLSLGFEQAGFDVVAAVEIDPIHAAVHEYNFPYGKTICADIKNITGADIRQMSGIGLRDVDVIVGGAPCQGFSLIGKRAIDDPRNQLIRHYLRIVSDIRPKYCVLENVKGLTVGKHKKFLAELVAELGKINYNVLLPYKVLNAADYGVPQNRERLFLIAARKDQVLPDYPKPASIRVTIKEAIKDLPDADGFDVLQERDSVAVKWRTTEKYARQLRGLDTDATDFAHQRRFNRDMLTSSLRTNHGEISRERFLATPQGETEPHSRFFKLAWRGQSNTLRAGTDSARGGFTSPRPIHPELPRVITVREAARIHSYPDWFRFNRTKWHGFREIGNSVPPRLARAVGANIIKALGVTPVVPEVLSTGDEELLFFDMKSAADHFGVSRNVIAQRTRKTNAD